MKMTQKIRTLCFFTGLSLTLVACGDEPAEQVNPNENNDDIGEDADCPPNALCVNDEDRITIGDIPAEMLVTVSPSRYVYALDTRITPTADVFNYDWQPLGDAIIEWSVTPEESVEKDGDNNRWFVRQEGEVIFQACAEVPSLFPEVCASRTVLVAQSGPTITLESPAPGAHYLEEEHPLVPVEGIVSSPAEIQSVQINGVDVDLDDDGRFRHEVTPVFGINTVTVRAFDGVHDTDGVAASSFIWAPAYKEVAYDTETEELSTSLDDAIILQLGQNFFDNGDDPIYISDTQILTEDLADIIYLVLTYLDLNSQLPNPVVDSDNFQLSVPNVAVENPRVEIDVTETGIQLYAQIQDLVAETDGFLELSDQSLSLVGQIVARLSIYAEVTVDKPSPDAPIEVKLVDFQLAIESASPQFEAPEANAVFELANSALRESLEDLILDSVNLSFIDTLPELLTDVFGSLEEAMAYQQFDLNLGFGEPLSLAFRGQIGQMQPIYRQGLEGFISADLSVSAPNLYPDNPGIALLHEGPAIFPFFSQGRVQIGLNLALVNAIFHNLWSAGLLNLDITEVIPSNFAALIQHARASGKLPPVAAPPIQAESHDLMLHLGQLELDLGWNDRTDRFGAAIKVGINLDISDGAIAIEISDEPQIDLWFIESTADQPFLDTATLLSLLRSQIWPQLEEAIGEGLSFGLPIPVIDGLDAFSPELADLELGIRMTRDIEERSGFLMLDAAFEGELFLP